MSAHSARPPSRAHAAGQSPRLGRRVARVNRVVTNKVMVHVAGMLPDMGIVTHVGRRTRIVYRTPVFVFQTMDGFRIALTYGRDSDWVKNALSHGAVRLDTRHREYELIEPEVVVDEHRQHVSTPLRGILRALRVTEFLDLRSTTPRVR
jgi:deazaflavin-dependent oxidoreductase (nitroreductase family)